MIKLIALISLIALHLHAVERLETIAPSLNEISIGYDFNKRAIFSLSTSLNKSRGIGTHSRLLSYENNILNIDYDGSINKDKNGEISLSNDLIEIILYKSKDTALQRTTKFEVIKASYKTYKDDSGKSTYLLSPELASYGKTFHKPLFTKSNFTLADSPTYLEGNVTVAAGGDFVAALQVNGKIEGELVLISKESSTLGALRTKGSYGVQKNYWISNDIAHTINLNSELEVNIGSILKKYAPYKSISMVSGVNYSLLKNKTNYEKLNYQIKLKINF